MVEEDKEISPEPNRFTSKVMEEKFTLIEEWLAKFEAEDPSTARFTTVAREVLDSLLCYGDSGGEEDSILPDSPQPILREGIVAAAVALFNNFKIILVERGAGRNGSTVAVSCYSGDYLVPLCAFFTQHVIILQQAMHDW
ncbi:hypothetical protein SK128_025746 [Halocaridina rubra]|uniref:Uncharacterized protein n=1 Tax=Halocaridina rubra TaxID=373956 RepID=A0AAN8WKP1_HALRR